MWTDSNLNFPLPNLLGPLVNLGNCGGKPTGCCFLAVGQQGPDLRWTLGNKDLWFAAPIYRNTFIFSDFSLKPDPRDSWRPIADDTFAVTSDFLASCSVERSRLRWLTQPALAEMLAYLWSPVLFLFQQELIISHFHPWRRASNLVSCLFVPLACVLRFDSNNKRGEDFSLWKRHF